MTMINDYHSNQIFLPNRVKMFVVGWHDGCGPAKVQNSKMPSNLDKAQQPGRGAPSPPTLFSLERLITSIACDCLGHANTITTQLWNHFTKSGSETAKIPLMISRLSLIAFSLLVARFLYRLDCNTRMQLFALVFSLFVALQSLSSWPDQACSTHELVLQLLPLLLHPMVIYVHRAAISKSYWRLIHDQQWLRLNIHVYSLVINL